MGILHRHLFREVFVATVIAVALMAFVLLGGTAINDIVGRAASGQLTVVQAATLMLHLTPFVLTYALPFGLLTAVLLVLGRLSAQHEITAMRSAGIGLVRLAAPVMLIAVLGVALSLVINYNFAPRAKTLYRKILFEVGQQNPEKVIVPGTFVRDFPNLVIFARDRSGEFLEDIWVWEMDGQHRVKRSYWFERASLRLDEDAGKLEITVAGLMQPDIRDEKNPENFSRISGYPTVDGNGANITFDLGDVFKRKPFEQKVSWMDFGELVAERRRLLDSTDPADRARLQDVKMNLHEKGSFAFSVLSFALIAVPLGIQTRRKETSANLALALALMLLFYFGIISASWLERHPEMRPELMLWAPNISFQLVGAWLWWRFGKN